MEATLNTGGKTKSGLALSALLKARLGTSNEPTTLTPYEQKLLQQDLQEGLALLERRQAEAATTSAVLV